MSWTNNFLKISPNNAALQYINKRLQFENYRGSHFSQHNRYVMGDLLIILKNLDQVVPNGRLLPIRTTDISKRTDVKNDEIMYTSFCEFIRSELKKGSPDAMRKNYFPDFHRMGLITRYDKNENETDPYSRKPIKYVSITKLGLKFINANELGSYYIYSRCIGTLLEGRIEILLKILRDIELDTINELEYTFFISAVGFDSNFILSIDDAIKLIKSYRVLTPSQRRILMETIQKDLDVSLTKNNKLKKRDFHNWINETQQIYHLLKQTVYFDVVDHKLMLSHVHKTNAGLMRMLRSKSQMKNYFTKHLIDKKPGFELHHVIPLAWSESESHFKILDDWRNMAYIDGYSHAKITQNRSRNVIMHGKQDDLILKDFSENEVYLENKKNILYSVKKQKTMLEHNKKLLQLSYDS